MVTILDGYSNNKGDGGSNKGGGQQRGQGWQGVARAKAIATRVAGDEEGDSKGSKSNGNGNEVAGNKEGGCKRH